MCSIYYNNPKLTAEYMLLNLNTPSFIPSLKSNEPQMLTKENFAHFLLKYVLLILHVAKLSHYTHPIPKLKK